MANISETVRQRAISSKFWTRSVVEGYSVETSKFSISHGEVSDP